MPCASASLHAVKLINFAVADLYSLHALEFICLIIWWSNKKMTFSCFFEFVISFHPSTGVYVEKRRWIMPLGEALCQNPALQLVIPMRARRASPLPPTLSPDLCAVLLDMLAFDPDTRPTALQLQDRIYRAIDTP